MVSLTESYALNVQYFAAGVRAEESFDILTRTLTVGPDEVTLYYIDGFVKDAELQKLMQYFLSQKEIGTPEEFLPRLPQMETATVRVAEELPRALLSGQCVMFSSRFGAAAVVMDIRTYPARGVGEPESDKVMQGARDGFVETLITNTVLIRRRIRDPRLTMRQVTLGGASQTDVVVCYMDGVAEPSYVEGILHKLRSLRTKSLTLGFQSLAESLIRTGWWNPFPKIRTTERPDTAAAQVLEGSVLVLCDTSPQVMILPTSLLDYLQQTDDYYYPPLTGTYLRLVRTFILLLSVVSIPLWYLALQNAEILPPALAFLIPDEPGALPILLQLYLAEIAIDGLKIASMNTPDMLSNSLSVVGALLLGDFAVGVGWFCEDVILYMAFVAIANFAQQNHELGYAFKFMRMLILALTALAGVWGFGAGLALFCFFAATNRTIEGKYRYLYPLIPWNGNAMRHLLFRTKKEDFE